MNKYAYSPFGELLVEQEQVTLNIGFNTKYEDESGLTYYNNRYYSHSLGRFISQDPIFEEGGVNLYSFTANDPLNHWDVLGNEKFSLSVSNIKFSNITFVKVDEGDLGISSITGKISVAQFDFTTDISATVTASCDDDCPLGSSVSVDITKEKVSFSVPYRVTILGGILRIIPIVGQAYAIGTLLDYSVTVIRIVNDNPEAIKEYISNLDAILEEGVTIICKEEPLSL